MVGLVLVAHSRPLADALMGLIRQFAPPELSIAVAAGAGADRLEFGTDAVEIAEAIQTVYTPEGVLVLMDLGSAVLSAELALEFLPDEVRTNTRLCPGALVEGGIAAAVQAGLGSDLQTVAGEARQALQAKLAHFGEGDRPPAAQQVLSPVGKSITVALVNAHGLHARPAARMVQEAGNYAAEIWVVNATTGRGPASARSLNSLATLGAVKGHLLTITASGPQADQAVHHLEALVQSGFGKAGIEEPFLAPLESDVLPSTGGARLLQGIPVSEGIALGAIYIHRPEPAQVPDTPVENPAAEMDRLERALQQARLAIQERRRQLAASLGEAKAAILDAHLLILHDPDMQSIARRRILEDGMNAAAAWRLTLRETAGRYDSLEDAYQRERAADVIEAGNQVLSQLVGQPPRQEITLPGPGILAARELSVGEISQLDVSPVLGVVTSSGGRTSHGAILLRSMGLPAVSGIDLSGLTPGALAALDGSLGCVWLEPEMDEQLRLAAERQHWLVGRRQRMEASRQPAVLPSGRRIEVAANVGNMADARAASLNGADGVGVLRTEFLFLNRLTPPSEAEQLDLLTQICLHAGGGAVIVRTLDIGGDKRLPYLPLPEETNPYLGVRAIRLSQHQPELFQTQLRAILRAGATHPVRVMFPMVASLEEFLWAREQLESAHQALQRESLPHAWPVQAGIMIEVPSAALLSDLLAPHIDFLSAGTNDLTQYTLAAERGNPRLADYADALHPAVLRQIKMSIDAAHAHGRWAGVCGEVAADPLAAVLLVGLGVDELSMNPADIPQVKAALRGMDEEQAAHLAVRALDCPDAAEVRRLAGEILRTA